MKIKLLELRDNLYDLYGRKGVIYSTKIKQLDGSELDRIVTLLFDSEGCYIAFRDIECDVILPVSDETIKVDTLKPGQEVEVRCEKCKKNYKGSFSFYKDRKERI